MVGLPRGRVNHPTSWEAHTMSALTEQDFIQAYDAAAQAAVDALDAHGTPDAISAASRALFAVRIALALPEAFLREATIREIADLARGALLDLRQSLDLAVTEGPAEACVSLVYACYELGQLVDRLPVRRPSFMLPTDRALVSA